VWPGDNVCFLNLETGALQLWLTPRGSTPSRNHTYIYIYNNIYIYIYIYIYIWPGDNVCFLNLETGALQLWLTPRGYTPSRNHIYISFIYIYHFLSSLTGLSTTRLWRRDADHAPWQGTCLPAERVCVFVRESVCERERVCVRETE